MLMLKDHYCPICHRSAIDKRGRTWIECGTHGWIENPIIKIDLEPVARMTQGKRDNRIPITI